MGINRLWNNTREQQEQAAKQRKQKSKNESTSAYQRNVKDFTNRPVLYMNRMVRGDVVEVETDLK